jgi:1-acyl-sn-glycerol-3-phosphate acyltransferase
VQASTDWVTAVVLVGFVLGLFLWIGAALRRSPYSLGHSVLYFFNVLLTRVLWRTEIIGRFEVPPGRGAVLISNHRSSVDPFFLQFLPGRVVDWMVAEEYFRIPLVGAFLHYTGSIPTRRGGVDTAATRRAIRYARDNELVGMLPEGRINSGTDFLLPGRPGAVLVALKGRVPIIPCYIEGAPYDGTFWGCFFMTARVQLVVGHPIDLSEYYDRKLSSELQGELTLRLLREITRLGGRPDFEPRLAGRHWKPRGQALPA